MRMIRKNARPWHRCLKKNRRLDLCITPIFWRAYEVKDGFLRPQRRQKKSKEKEVAEIPFSASKTKKRKNLNYSLQKRRFVKKYFKNLQTFFVFTIDTHVFI